MMRLVRWLYSFWPRAELRHLRRQLHIQETAWEQACELARMNDLRKAELKDRIAQLEIEADIARYERRQAERQRDDLISETRDLGTIDIEIEVMDMEPDDLFDLSDVETADVGRVQVAA